VTFRSVAGVLLNCNSRRCVNYRLPPSAAFPLTRVLQPRENALSHTRRLKPTPTNVLIPCRRRL